MKKLLALLLVLAMVLSMAACGKTAPDPTDPPKATDPVKTPDQTTAPTEDDKRVDVEELDTSWIVDEDPTAVTGTVNFYIPFKGSQGMDAMIAAFNEIYPNVEVVLNTYSNNSDGNASVNTAILAGEVDVLASFGLANTDKRWSSIGAPTLSRRMAPFTPSPPAACATTSLSIWMHGTKLVWANCLWTAGPGMSTWLHPRL